VEKIMEIDEHVGCAMSGLIADARTLVEHARVETQVHIGYYLYAIHTLCLFTT
jgi:20S proteasome subunit alpha 5